MTGSRLLQIVLEVLASCGLRGDDVLHAARGLRAIAHGFATLETSGGFGLPVECDESFDRAVLAYLQGLRSQAETGPGLPEGAHPELGASPMGLGRRAGPQLGETGDRPAGSVAKEQEHVHEG